MAYQRRLSDFRNELRAIYHETDYLGVAQPEATYGVSVHTKMAHTIMGKPRPPCGLGESVNPRPRGSMRPSIFSGLGLDTAPRGGGAQFRVAEDDAPAQSSSDHSEMEDDATQEAVLAEPDKRVGAILGELERSLTATPDMCDHPDVCSGECCFASRR